MMSLILLNIAGGDSVDDLRILEKDEGLVKVVAPGRLFRPSPQGEAGAGTAVAEGTQASLSLASGSLPLSVGLCKCGLKKAKRAMGQAFIPAANECLQALRRVNPDLLRFAQTEIPADRGHPGNGCQYRGNL